MNASTNKKYKPKPTCKDRNFLTLHQALLSEVEGRSEVERQREVERVNEV